MLLSCLDFQLDEIENYLKHNQLVIHFPVLPIYYGRIQSQGSPILNLVALQNMNFSPLVKIFKIKECLLSHQTTANNIFLHEFVYKHLSIIIAVPVSPEPSPIVKLETDISVVAIFQKSSQKLLKSFPAIS